MANRRPSPKAPDSPPPAAPTPAPAPITLHDVWARLTGLGDLLEDLAEPATRGLTDDLAIQAGTLLYLSATVHEFADRCEAAASAKPGSA